MIVEQANGQHVLASGKDFPVHSQIAIITKHLAFQYLQYSGKICGH